MHSWAESIRTEQWKSPEEIVEVGFQNSRVVMLNELHSGMLRCVRTRELGRQLLPTADAQGAGWLAAEALTEPFAEEANRTRKLPAGDVLLAQPDMRALLQSALDLGWQLVAYDVALHEAPAGLSELEKDNWREQQQAWNLNQALRGLPPEAKMLVWCGNGHNSEVQLGPLRPMGLRFKELSGIDPYTIDQGITVSLGSQPDPVREGLRQAVAPVLAARKGLAALTAESVPLAGGRDAYIFASDNSLS